VLLPAYPSVRKALGVSRVVTEIAQPGGVFPSALLLAGTTPTGVPVFALDCLPLFARGGDPYLDANGSEWPDNHVRFGLLSKIAALMAHGVPGLDWAPQILHCNDWHTGLVPAYLHFAGAANVKSVFTIHNIAYQGNFPPGTLEQLALPARAFAIDGVEYHGQISFLKAGLQYADALTTVSPTYAREIQGEELGFGFAGLLRQRAAALTGILNGIDTTLWNCATDVHLAQHYDSGSLAAKAANKAALQRRLKLPVTDDMPLLGVVSRLTQQKGLDLVAEIADEIGNLPAQLVVLGAGDKALEKQYFALARKHGDRCAVFIGFDESLAHLIEAGADMFLMPSRFEPCGLNQMYSMRYGTVPVVHGVGGLADTVVDYSPGNKQSTGFVMVDYTPAALLEVLSRAMAVYADRRQWQTLQLAGMQQDFSWDRSAREYVKIYERALAGAGG
jgi:starch synthase